MANQGKITKLRSTGMSELDDKWFTTYMAEIHGTLGRISEAGGKAMEDIRDLYTKGISYEVATEFDGLKPTKWEKQKITDPHEALRVKIIEMLGSEGPAMGDQISSRLPFPPGQIDSILHENTIYQKTSFIAKGQRLLPSYIMFTKSPYNKCQYNTHSIVNRHCTLFVGVKYNLAL